MKIAGLLQYPPAMYAQIEPWAVSVWCGHVADKFAYSAQDKKTVVLQALSELEAEYQRVQAWWEHVKDKPDQRYSFKIPKWTSYGIQYLKVVVSTKSEMWDPETGHIVLNLTGRPHEGNRLAIYDLKGIVVLTQDEDPQDRTRYWLIKSIKRYMTMAINNLDAEVGYKGYDSDKDRAVYQAAMKYTNKAKGYTASASQKFPVNLTGWKYLEGLDLNPKPITVKLDFVGHTKRGGQWNPHNWELQVDMPQKMPESAKELESQIVRIRAILIHELRHVAQTLLQQGKNLKSVGVPTRVPNQPKAVSRWDLPHALRPIEFYPRLGDEVSAFLHRYSTGWTPTLINGWVKSQPFFQALKQHKPDDWRKAVKHFVEQVQQARAERLAQKVGGQMKTSRQQMIERIAAYKSKKDVKINGKETTIYEYSDRQISKRHNEKAKRLEAFSGKLSKLREKVKGDLKSKDPKVKGLALAVALVDHTYERIGNPTSAKEGHFGVTGWQVKHLSFKGAEAILQYVGKSGVKHRKTVDIKWLVDEIRKAVDGRKDTDTIVHDGENPIKASDVNGYLDGFEITAKDLRGYHANTLMQRELRKVKGTVAKDPKKREEQLKTWFQTALDTVSELVGHLATTLKGQYLVPGLEDQFLKDGTVMDGFVE